MSVGRETSESIPWTRHTDTRHAYRREPRGFITNTSVRSLCSSSLLPTCHSMWWNSFETATRGAARSGPLSPLCGTCGLSLVPFSTSNDPPLLILLSFSLRASSIDDISKSFPLFVSIRSSLHCSPFIRDYKFICRNLNIGEIRLNRRRSNFKVLW